MDWDKFFFSNVGKKIKSIIRGIFYTEVVLLLITGVILEIAALVNLIMEGDGEFFLIMLGIPVGLVLAIGALWLSTLLTYGFAEIVDTAIVNRNEEKKSMMFPTIAVASSAPSSSKPHWVCPQCGNRNDVSKNMCSSCWTSYWPCSKCGVLNGEKETVCVQCESKRPNSYAHVPAMTNDSMEYGTCPGCGATVLKGRCPLCNATVR